MGRVVLVAAHHLQDAVCLIRHGVEADQLVRDGDREQALDHLLPAIDRLVIKVCPVEGIIAVKLPVRPGVREVECFLRLYRYEDLD